MTQQEIVDLLIEKEVLLEGHFLLTSGRHSNKYMQCAKLFQYPEASERICKHLSKKFAGESADLVVGPAVGGIIMAYEMSRQLHVPNIFAERDDTGAMCFRRGFHIPKGANVLVVEDVVTTGGSVKEVIDLIAKNGGNVIGVGSVVDRSNGEADFEVPYHAVHTMQVITYDPEDCPLCKEGIEIDKPGSRKTI